MIDQLIDSIIEREGGYVYHEADRGGPTRYGITQATARNNGYLGDMQRLPIEIARDIYRHKYYLAPNFHKVAELSESISEELTDTGVNMGTARAGMFLQKALNALNRKGIDYSDLTVDGAIGQKSLNALRLYLSLRSHLDGEEVLLKALNCLQGAKYIDIAEHDHDQEAFVFGWLRNRVSL